MIAPLAPNLVGVHHASVALERPTDSADGRRQQRILTAPGDAGQQHAEVYFNVGMLELERQHVQQQLTLGDYGQHRRQVVQPQAHVVTLRARRPRVLPSVA